MRSAALEGMRWTSLQANGILGTKDLSVTTEVLYPGAELAPVLDRFWAARWTADAPEPGRAVVVPYPETSLLLHRGKVYVSGIRQGRIAVTPRAEGSVYVAVLRAGAVPYLLGRPATEFVDRVTPLRGGSGALDPRILAAEARGVDALRGFGAAIVNSLGRPHALQPRGRELIDRIVAEACETAAHTRVSDLCARFHVSSRTLQRLFHLYLGVTPKWLLCRYRVHSAARRLQSESPVRLTELAASLGYFDEPHFVRDFGDAVGITPAAFVRAARNTATPVEWLAASPRSPRVA